LKIVFIKIRKKIVSAEAEMFTYSGHSDQCSSPPHLQSSGYRGLFPPEVMRFERIAEVT
jgi:hypothetical protein